MPRCDSIMYFALVVKIRYIRDISWILNYLRVICIIGTTVSWFCPPIACGVGNDRFHPGLSQLLYLVFMYFICACSISPNLAPDLSRIFNDRSDFGRQNSKVEIYRERPIDSLSHIYTRRDDDPRGFWCHIIIGINSGWVWVVAVTSFTCCLAQEIMSTTKI